MIRRLDFSLQPLRRNTPSAEAHIRGKRQRNIQERRQTHLIPRSAERVDLRDKFTQLTLGGRSNLVTALLNQALGSILEKGTRTITVPTEGGAVQVRVESGEKVRFLLEQKTADSKGVKVVIERTKREEDGLYDFSAKITLHEPYAVSEKLSLRIDSLAFTGEEPIVTRKKKDKKEQRETHEITIANALQATFNAAFILSYLRGNGHEDLVAGE